MTLTRARNYLADAEADEANPAEIKAKQTAWRAMQRRRRDEDVRADDAAADYVKRRDEAAKCESAPTPTAQPTAAPS
jgi:hypothetical protein